MSFTVQTPQRHLPGAYQATPAGARYQAISIPPPPRFGPLAASTSQDSLTARTPNEQPPASGALQTNKSPPAPEDPVERAARTINDSLAQETRYPELDSYIGQGISSDYEIPYSHAWTPFQKSKMYDIPDKIFDQYNQAQVSTMMGLFADLNHAWITIDNALYLWDYTHPNPDLVGFEEQPNSITAVRLVKPRAGVFIPSITHLLVVATTAELLLIGLSYQPGPEVIRKVELYQTKLSLPMKGVDIDVIEGSPATGRIFFSRKGEGDVYELTYQQEEKWFQNRCGKINHTSTGFAPFAPTISLTFAPKPHEHVVQMVVDDSRSLLYTLSSTSTIRTFHMRAPNNLELAIVRTMPQILSNIGHMVSRTELLSPGVKVVSISPISSREAHKLHLVAMTSTGCRLFLSATSSYAWASDSTGAPTSMQVQHVKFPPPTPGYPKLPQSQSSQVAGPYQGASVDTQSRTLDRTRFSRRFAPGYFFTFVQKDPEGLKDSLFLSSPDSGRIARPPEASQMMMSRYQEQSHWVTLESRAEDVGLVSPPFGAAPTPAGFGNELAVQFDAPTSEVAILTNTGIHIIRRRRLVDIFAAAIRFGGGEEGLEGEVKTFIRLYGRGEIAATALAVACGQGLDVTADSRVARITDPDILEFARKSFIEFGGKPVFNENTMIDQSNSAIDSVRPSPRHEGVALYIARLVRSIWKMPILAEGTTPLGGLVILSRVSLEKIKDIQRELAKLQEFLDANKSFIDGLAGPEALSRVSSRSDEVAMMAEHRALYSLVLLIPRIIEGISFVLVLFDERVDEIILSLSDTARQQVRQLTYEGLFSTKRGKELAKELVKAIVNRNIASGSNVDTVAEALRRRCGSFCSSDDVITFKAQEQVKKASEAGGNSDSGRRLLNESLRLFQQVAATLSMEILQWAVQQFTTMEFYAGAIQLALSVAKEVDRGNFALAWINDGSPPSDTRELLFNQRTEIYKLTHGVIAAVDHASSQSPEMVDGSYTLTAKRRSEAYAVIDESDDEVFQYDLYGWYLSQGFTDRLLAVGSPYVVSYLQGKSKTDVAHADLLWRYYALKQRYYDAAGVQWQLAKSEFPLSLDKRIEYLSKAKANASTYSTGTRRQPRQVLLHEVTELLDIANIQDDVLQRLKGDDRLTTERKQEVLTKVDGPILSLSELYNNYADQASYFDICLLIYQVADHRNSSDVTATWQNLLDAIHKDAVDGGVVQPYEAVADKVRSLGNRLSLSENTFPIPTLLPMLERYAYENQRDVGPPAWVIDTFLDIHVPYESLLSVLEGMFYNDEAPFRGRNRRVIGNDILYLCQKWFSESLRSGGRAFGDEGTAAAVSQTLQVVGQNDMDPAKQQELWTLRERIEQHLR
ncbi:MAG: hypothetical protein M4579_003742 [Chaenotheca gracillima]|nr:MAG: hypothetical protein M4579_003742 [Chaenotheca gracillima]